MSVRIEGQLFRGSVKSVVRRSLETTRVKTLESTRRRSRVKTGRMRAGWTIDVDESNRSARMIGNNNVFYTVFQELGTSRISPMLALTTSMQEANGMFQQTLQHELAASLGGRIEYLAATTIDALRVSVFGGSLE